MNTNIRKTIKHGSLYLVTSREYVPQKPSLDIIRQAVEAGVDMVQVREKKLDAESLEALVRQALDICRKKNALLIVNDDPQLAKTSGADGVHLGQEDVKKHPVHEARAALGTDKIIGLSTHSIEQVKQANDCDVDYIGFGPVFPTKTKDYCIGLGGVREALRVSRHPVIFIGGINTENAAELFGLGARNIALIRGIIQAGNIAERVDELRQIMLKYTKGDNA